MGKLDIIGYAPCPDPACNGRAEIREKQKKSGPGCIYIIHDNSGRERGCGAILNLPYWDRATAPDFPGFVPLAKETVPKPVVPKPVVPKPVEPKPVVPNPVEPKPVEAKKPSLARMLWDGGGDDAIE